MKLWQKTFICTLFTVMFSISIVAVLILKNNFQSSINRQIDSAYKEHNYMISNLHSRVMSERLKKNSIVLTTKEITDVMSSTFENADNKENTIVGLFNSYNETLYNNSVFPIDLNLLNKTVSSKQSCKQILELDNEHYLYISSNITLETQEFIFVTRTNISELYNLYETQLEYTKILGGCLSLISAIFLLIIIKLLLIPLSSLNNNIKAIANGNYSDRIDVFEHDEIGELAVSMNKMADTIEENITTLSNIAENRKQFINNLSHEMKTPLTSILGFADILRIKREISNEEFLQYTGIIIEETKRLQNISGKLMELITVGETEIDFKEIQITDILNQIELIFRPALEKHELTMHADFTPCIVNIDSELFKSMLFNIIDNAIKASKLGGNIYVSNVVADNTITFIVKDEGIGIDANDLEKITEPFYMVDKVRSRKAGGAGLGLALCQRIAAIHNATIHFDSTKDVGTTVTIAMEVKNEKI